VHDGVALLPLSDLAGLQRASGVQEEELASLKRGAAEALVALSALQRRESGAEEAVEGLKRRADAAETELEALRKRAGGAEGDLAKLSRDLKAASAKVWAVAASRGHRPLLSGLGWGARWLLLARAPLTHAWQRA
jgi:hypothetical protein